MNTNIFHSIILWGLVIFFVLIVFLFIHPTSRKEILGSRDLPTKSSRLSSALPSDRADFYAYLLDRQKDHTDFGLSSFDPVLTLIALKGSWLQHDYNY